MSILDKEILDLSKTIQEASEAVEGGYKTDSKCFDSVLKAEDETLVEASKKIKKLRDMYVAAHTHAAGVMGIADMKKDKKLDEIKLSSKVMGDTVVSRFSRSTEVSKGFGSKERETRKGVCVTRYSAKFGGATKKVRDHLVGLSKDL